jgi:predicted RNase H-like HicB family nuclease
MHTYDCHGKTYDEVLDELENWLCIHYADAPFEIITGNSEQMKQLVMDQLEELDFNYGVPANNNGVIKVF